VELYFLSPHTPSWNGADLEKNRSFHMYFKPYLSFNVISVLYRLLAVLNKNSSSNLAIFVSQSIVHTFKCLSFWVVTPCSDVLGHKYVGGPCCLHLQGEVETTIRIFITVNTSNLAYVFHAHDEIWNSHMKHIGAVSNLRTISVRIAGGNLT